MDFNRDESQDAVAEVVVSLLERNTARDIELWPALTDSGLLSVALPQRCGGDGMGLLEVSVLLTELATDAVAAPALATLGFGVLPLLEVAPEPLADKIFAAVAQGAVLTATLHEPGTPFAAAPETTAVVDGERATVTGRKVAVPYADSARWVLVPTDSGIAIVDAEAPGISRFETPNSTGAPEFSMHFEQTEIPAEQLLPGGLRALHRLALAGIGSVADGLLRGALTLTAEHVRTRHQFGRPLAEFQAVAQQIADVYVVSRTLHAAALSANWALAHADDDPGHQERIDDDLDVLAYCVASELPAAMQKCHHLHGGIGVDVTHPLHRYYSQAKDLARWLGGASFRLDRLGDRCSST
ncbi:acyl-CoA dehydrogenase family protein [Nocardia terpenica]|uniref:Acyl-CoA dehydrogenase n=1 Tax=Nocardia terpenica TaxID=455432 RepID=A0A164HR61_9NOCA|nr:acyl-CoA dehydrogenase family protein [Nocardia terpenica]KZM68735.1 acyl-CoA dehydrogenase [Nocardia terpenica]NQE88243.1 acyl-CoA/acyl-ACP dehydrogenase [Nocardia terpenica]